MKNIIIMWTVVILLCGCTSIEVKPLESGIKNQVACIEENDKVIVPHFLDILRNGFEKHDFITRVYERNADESCKLLVSYTATRDWDLVPYLSDAEVWIRNRSGARVGYGQYHLRGGGGFAVTKWASTESKMEQVFGQLFASY